jgi:hypothetical protein
LQKNAIRRMERNRFWAFRKRKGIEHNWKEEGKESSTFTYNLEA